MPKPTPKLIVLKFGGSVLLDEQRLRIAVHEIYRWRREGWRVIAVVSALAGRTDELIARCNTLNQSASATTKAALIANGERESATLLGVHLDRSGIPARVYSPEAVSLIASGDPLNAHPLSIDRTAIDHALSADGVVVLPGFVAVNDDGESVTLGRGGSDLSAVFVAHALNAERCRLIKDVDALYTSDPAATEILPERFSYASYDDALSTDGSIIQHKAVRFAKRFGIEFELGRFNGTRPTTIGPGLTRHDDSPDIPTVSSVALCGLGTVGAGVADLISQLPDQFNIIGAARRTVTSIDFDRAFPVRQDAIELATLGADIVVELIGGYSVADEVARTAMKHGSNVVTANKALIAEDHEALNDLAGIHGITIRCSASVGGAAPVLESLEHAPVVAVEGILNGTGNYVLAKLGDGTSFPAAVHEAQAQGFAETDPSRDLDGRDSLDKLRVIAHQLGWDVPGNAWHTSSIATWASNTESKYPARQVAYLDQRFARVLVKPVEPESVFAKVRDEWNIAILHHPDGSTTKLRGKGAGRWPTSEAVIADLLEHARMKCAEQYEERCHAI
jgi:homoserine dehydrogenase